MARFDSGGTGSGGDAPLDDTEESTTEQQQTEQQRQLRRDANSDPMRQQTETTEVQSAGPVEQTGGGGGDPMGSPTRDTSPGASGTGGGLDRGGAASGSSDSSAGFESGSSETTSVDTQTQRAQATQQSRRAPMAGGGDTPRANQSVSLGTTGVGTSGTNQSRERAETTRANQSVSLGTTGVGTTGTEQSRTREQTERASESVSLGTTGMGGSGNAQSRKQGEPALTTADRELIEGEMAEREREQFGDIDWSLGLGDPEEDEVERFVDEQIGEGGSQWVSENVSDPLREWGQGAKANNAFVSTDPPEWADYGQGAPNTVGAGEAAGNLAIGAANLAEAAPRLPAAALEGVETADYLLEATPVAGGSEEQFDRRIGQTAAAGTTLLQQEAQRARENPGAFAGEAAASYGLGKAVSFGVRATTGVRVGSAADTSAARQTISTYTPDLPESGGRSGGMQFRSFAGDDRGQVDLSGLGRESRRSESNRVTSDDLDVEPAENFDLAEERREFLVSKAERSLQQRREFEDSLPGDDGDAPIGEYTAPRREGGSLSEQEFRTASGGPDTSRSGPTATQQRAFRGGTSSDRAVSLGPGEGWRARRLDTPTDDLRALDQLSRDLVDSPGETGRVTESSGVAATGAAGGVGVSVVDEIGVGEGTADATQPATFSLDEETNRGAVGVGAASATQTGAMFADVETVSDTSVEVDALEDSLAPSDTVTGVMNGVGSPTDIDTTVGDQSRTGTDLGTDIAQGPATDLAPDTQQPVAVAPIAPATPAPTTPPAPDPGDPFGPRFGPSPNTSTDPDPTPRTSPDPSPDRLRFDDEDGDRRRRRRRRGEREGFARRVNRSLLNPFTGE